MVLAQQFGPAEDAPAVDDGERLLRDVEPMDLPELADPSRVLEVVAEAVEGMLTGFLLRVPLILLRRPFGRGDRIETNDDQDLAVEAAGMTIPWPIRTPAADMHPLQVRTTSASDASASDASVSDASVSDASVSDASTSRGTGSDIAFSPSLPSAEEPS